MSWDKYPPRQLYTTIHYSINLMTRSSAEILRDWEDGFFDIDSIDEMIEAICEEDEDEEEDN